MCFKWHSNKNGQFDFNNSFELKQRSSTLNWIKDGEKLLGSLVTSGPTKPVKTLAVPGPAPGFRSMDHMGAKLKVLLTEPWTTVWKSKHWKKCSNSIPWSQNNSGQQIQIKSRLHSTKKNPSIVFTKHCMEFNWTRPFYKINYLRTKCF